MLSTRYVKSFSQGQITIPKEFRNKLNLGQDFWLKLVLTSDKIIAKPAEELKPATKTNYAKRLLQIKGDWFDVKDWKKTKQDVETRLSYDQ